MQLGDAVGTSIYWFRHHPIPSSNHTCGRAHPKIAFFSFFVFTLRFLYSRALISASFQFCVFYLLFFKFPLQNSHYSTSPFTTLNLLSFPSRFIVPITGKFIWNPLYPNPNYGDRRRWVLVVMFTIRFGFCFLPPPFQVYL